MNRVVWKKCGIGDMLINGKPRQACTALIQPILEASGSRVMTLAPFSKFPLVRDLFVNRIPSLRISKKSMLGSMRKILLLWLWSANRTKSSRSFLCSFYLYDMRLLLRGLSAGQCFLPFYGAGPYIAGPSF